MAQNLNIFKQTIFKCLNPVRHVTCDTPCHMALHGASRFFSHTTATMFVHKTTSDWSSSFVDTTIFWKRSKMRVVLQKHLVGIKNKQKCSSIILFVKHMFCEKVTLFVNNYTSALGLVCHMRYLLIHLTN